MPIYFHGNRVAPVKLVYSGGYDTYSGSYTINPAITATILSTSNKLLTQNITITAMPSLTLPQTTANSATSGYTFITTIDPSTSDRYINIGTGYNNNASYYKISKMPSGTAGTPAATKGSVSNNTISITPTVTNTTGYITGSTITGNPVSVSASELVSDTLSITSNGIKDVTNYASVNVNISASSVINNQNKTITPTESQQIISADNGYTGLGNVTIQPISSTYIGSEIDLRDSTDLSVSGSTITVPSGYYSVSASKSVSSGTAGTPTASKGAVTNHSISITPSVINTTGYITGSTKTGTAVSVTASELVSGTLSITSNGTKDVTNYKNVNVQIGSDINNQDKTISPTTSEQIITADSGYSGLGTVTINAMPSGTVTAPASISGSSATLSNGTNTITLTKTISVTPNVTTAGYVSSGTAGNASVSLTANVTTKGATSYTPTTTSQTIVSGTYLTGNQTILGDSNLVAGNIKKNISIFGVTGTYEPPAGDTINNQDKTVTPTESEQSISADSGYTGLGVVTVEGISSTYIGSGIAQRSSSNLTVSGATVTVPAGYYSEQATKSVANGSVDYPTASKGTVSNHSINIRPSISYTEGYITSGTKMGTAITVSASELVSGNKSITSNGTNIDVTNYATVDVNVSSGSFNGAVTQDQDGYLVLSNEPGTNINITPASPKDVNFIDYDGTILYSYTKSEFAQLTALPANPDHSGDEIPLTSQGWNWTLAQINAQLTAQPNDPVTVGQMYVTADGKTYIEIELHEGRLSPYLGIAVNGTVVVDWGDNTATSTVTGSSLTTQIRTLHEYATAGRYTISISVSSGSFAFYGSSAYSLLNKNSSTANQNRVYSNAVQSVRIGNYASIGNYAFYGCYSLASITIPSEVTSIGTYAFDYCYSLVSIIIPSEVTSIGNNVWYYCYSLASITIPSGITSIGSYALYSCISLASITIPSGITSIGSYAFQNCTSLTSINISSGVTSIDSSTLYGCYSLSSLTIPSGITSIGSQAFYNCYGFAKLRFLPTTPPTVANSNAFSSIPTDCVISVPTGSLSAYTSATNYPDSGTYTYIEE